MSQCFGRTRTFARCRRDARRFFCLHHRWQPLLALFATISAVAMGAGLYQDLLKPLGTWRAFPAEQDKHEPILEGISVPLTIRNELRYDAMINQTLEYYLTRSITPATEEVVESGAVRIPAPADFTLVNEKIAISPRQTLSTFVQLPPSEMLAAALAKGGYGLKLVISNEWVDHFFVHKDVVFDEETIRRGVHLAIWKNS